MNSTRILLKIELNSILRRKLTTFMSIILPLAFYLLFTSILDLPEEAKKQFNKDYMYSMTTFSLINFCLMQFPFGMIEEKTNGWYKRLTTIPIAPSNYFLAKVLKTMLLFFCSIVLIFSVAHFYKDVTLEISQWILSGLVLWVGASLFLTLGLVIAQFNDIQKASSIANLLNLGMAILGGLWFPTNTFPDWLQMISKWMPTYQLKQVAIELSKGHSIPINSSLLLVVYSIIFLIIALLINKKKEVK